MPDHFNTVLVSFTEECGIDDFKKGTGNLFFYSGGVDSTYSILKTDQEESPSLLTVHGMDYKYHDEDRFKNSSKKLINSPQNLAATGFM